MGHFRYQNIKKRCRFSLFFMYTISEINYYRAYNCDEKFYVIYNIVYKNK